MQEIRFNIRSTETANMEILPTEEGIEVIIRYGKNTVRKQNNAVNNTQDIIDSMKAAARDEYKKENCDKKELKKFVEFWERKINEDGWRGNRFDFKKLYESWLKNKK